MDSIEGILMFFIPFSIILAYSVGVSYNNLLSCRNMLSFASILVMSLITYGLLAMIVFISLHIILIVGSMMGICCQDVQWNPTMIGFNDVCSATIVGTLSGMISIASVAILYGVTATVMIIVFVLTKTYEFIKDRMMKITKTFKFTIKPIVVIRSPNTNLQFIQVVDEV
jgi:hypothetical protein